MKKLPLSLCSILLVLMFIAGCAKAPQNTTEPSRTAATVDEAFTTAETTGNTTSATENTTPVTTVFETTAIEVVYAPIDENKVSNDIEQTTQSKPTTPSNNNKDNSNSSDDEKTPSKPTLDTRYKYVAFTFDDGPHYELTYKFVDKLAEYGGVGTFYVVGNRIHGTQADALEYAYNMGNEIGVHGYTHEVYYNSCSESRFRSEIDKTAEVIKNITGQQPLTMRPIGGGITSSRVKSSGFAVINWNVDSNDWRYTDRTKANVDKIVKNVLNSTDEGDIILMHEIYYNSYDAFCQIIDNLYKRGYRFVTVSQLLELDESDKGKIFYNAY